MYELRYVSDNGNVIPFGFSSGFVLGSVNDLSAISINMSMSQGIGQVGGTVQGEAIPFKDVILTGTIVGIVGTLRRFLLDTILPGVGGKLVWGNVWELAVRPLVIPTIENYDSNANFQFTLRAPYPYWRSHAAATTDLAGMEPMFSFPWNYEEPHIFGKRTASQLGNVINTGNVPANFIVTFIATTALQNPQIMKVATREIIRITRDMLAGEVVTVDMTVSPMRVTSTYKKVTVNVFGDLDLESVPFKLEVGDNILQYDAASNVDGLDCRIRFRPAVTGPY